MNNVEGFFDDIRLVDKADDPHLPLALGTGKRIGLIDSSDEVGPALFWLLGYRRRGDLEDLRLPANLFSIELEAAGIETVGWQYPQPALTLNLQHARSHHDISTEFHTEAGPFTLVPLPGLRSSLVFVVEQREVPRLTAMIDSELAEEVERRSHSILGKMTVEPGRGVFPLEVETVRRFGASRIVLAGEAAHVIPPIGAEGLNLGLRDAATIAELEAAARRRCEDVGAAGLTGRYEHMRHADVTSRTWAVDLLNRSLLTSFLPLSGARDLGLCLLEWIGPLRRAMMREGVAPAASQPLLMRGQAL